MIPDARQDDQTEFPGRPDHRDDKNSIRQFLVSSYKKTIYPSLKDEIQHSFQVPVHPSGVSPPRSMEK